MERGEQGYMQHMPEFLQSAVRKMDANPELSRRQVLGGLIAVTLAQGVSIAKWRQGYFEDSRTADSALSAGELCPEDYSFCQHDMLPDGTMAGQHSAVADNAAVPALGEAQTPLLVEAPAQQVNPVASSQPVPEVLEDAAGLLLEEPSCQYEILSSHECIMPTRSPAVVPFQRFNTENPADIEHINGLLAAVQVSPERYQTFKIDTSRAASLEQILSRKPIWPTVSVNHWVGYTELADNVDEYIERMKRSGLSYHTLTMGNGTMYLIAPTPHDLVGHAKYANWDSTGQAANANSLATLTPEMLEAMIYSELWLDKEYQRAMTRENSRSHAEVVRHDNITKVDWPSQLQDGFYHLKLTLNHLVYVEGKGGHPAPYSA